MGSGGPLSLQNWCDPTTSGWVGSIPTRSRQLASAARACLTAALIAAMLSGAAGSANAQVRDTIRPPAVVVEGPAVVVEDTTPRPPITPRRAFLYSLAVPGSAQTILDRPRTAAFFVTIEALSLAMMRKSANDLREAKRFARDSIVATYEIDPATGLARRDSTGALIPATFLPNRWGGVRVPARRTHLEDWIAVLVFNHLISGAEAFVSAQLWDLPGQVSMQRVAGETRITARIPW